MWLLKAGIKIKLMLYQINGLAIGLAIEGIF